MGKRDQLERLISVLAADDRAFAAQHGPERLAGKYEKLRKTPYKLFRATNALFIADIETLPEYWRTPAHELAGPLLGDAHPENFGAVGPSAAEAQMDCTDFDVVAEGPLARDLARAAAGLAIAEDQTPDRDAKALDSAPSDEALARVRLLATTWVERLLTGQVGLPGPSAFARQLAAVDTPVDAVNLGESTHVAVDHPDPALVAAAFAGYAGTTPAVRGARLAHAWLLHGKGASSFCVDRVIVRLSWPASPGADRLVEWKPQADAPTVAQAARERRAPATSDPLLGLVSIGGVGHVAQRWLTEDQKVRSKELHGAWADDVAGLLAVRLADLHRRFTLSVVERVRGQPAATIADALADLVAAYLPQLAAEWRALWSIAPAELAGRVATS
jgi:hypothetical protein